METEHFFYDDSGMLRSKEFGDIYFSNEGAMEETRHVFIDGNRLRQRLTGQDAFTIAEAGFGTGLNFLSTLHYKQTIAVNCSLKYIAFEMFPLPMQVLAGVYAEFPQLDFYAEVFLDLYLKHPPMPGLNHYPLPKYNTELMLYVGDINQTVEMLDGMEQIDAWYLDGFSPQCNSAMWGEGLFAAMQRHSTPGATAATYSCASAVRDHFTEYGFKWEKTPGFGNKRYMLQAVYEGGHDRADCNMHE